MLLPSGAPIIVGTLLRINLPESTPAERSSNPRHARLEWAQDVESRRITRGRVDCAPEYFLPGVLLRCHMNAVRR
jgi:hypothetical protein